MVTVQLQGIPNASFNCQYPVRPGSGPTDQELEKRSPEEMTSREWELVSEVDRVEVSKASSKARLGD